MTLAVSVVPWRSNGQIFHAAGDDGEALVYGDVEGSP